MAVTQEEVRSPANRKVGGSILAFSSPRFASRGLPFRAAVQCSLAEYRNGSENTTNEKEFDSEDPAT